MKKTLRFVCVCFLTLFLFSCQKELSENSVQNEIPGVVASVVSEQSTSDPSADCGQLRTQSQGGWGADPSGTNPGTYLHANFAAAFPSGLQVGCSSGYTVHYTSAEAITGFLPAGGTASVLIDNATNPAFQSIKNVLIGQVTALALNVGFDNYDPNFGAAGIPLRDMIIGSGPFAGKTISEFLTLANDVLGGCSNAYAPQDVNATAHGINKNYTNGNTDNGFLVCPDPTIR